VPPTQSRSSPANITIHILCINTISLAHQQTYPFIYCLSTQSLLLTSNHTHSCFVYQRNLACSPANTSIHMLFINTISLAHQQSSNHILFAYTISLAHQQTFRSYNVYQHDLTCSPADISNRILFINIILACSPANVSIRILVINHHAVLVAQGHFCSKFTHSTSARGAFY
jgi:hypothetical protein